MTTSKLKDCDVTQTYLEKFVEVQTRVIVFCIIMQCIATISTGIWISQKLRTTPHDVIEQLEEVSIELPLQLDAIAHRLDGDGSYPPRLQILLDAIKANNERLAKIDAELEELCNPVLTADEP